MSSAKRTNPFFYAVPTNPADPEAAALELIVRVPGELLGHDSPPTDVLQEFALLLDAEGCFCRHVVA